WRRRPSTDPPRSWISAMGLRFYQTGRLEEPAGRSAEQVSGLGLVGRRLAQEPLHHERVLDRIVAVVVVEGDEDLLGLQADALDFGQERERPIESFRWKAGRVDLAATRARGVPRQQRGEVGRDGLRARVVASQE